MRGILKWPLIIAAIVVVTRVVLERSGTSPGISRLFSVVVLYLLICPVYFAIRLGASGVRRPYLSLLKTIAIYAALARAMVIPTYWLAYLYQWPEGRFSTNQGGVVGEGVTPLSAYLLIPLGAGLVWIVASVIHWGRGGILFYSGQAVRVESGIIKRSATV